LSKIKIIIKNQVIGLNYGKYGTTTTTMTWTGTWTGTGTGTETGTEANGDERIRLDSVCS